MKIQINGSMRELTDSLFLSDLLLEMKLSPATLLVELNGNVIPRNQFSAIQLHENDKLELIRFVGGG
jgi:thiamine biosynthesis protein ThiS